MRYIDFESQSHWSVFTARQNHMQLQFKFDCCKGGCATKLQKKIKNCHLHRAQAAVRRPRHKDAVKNRLETGDQESQDARVLPPTTHCLKSRGRHSTGENLTIKSIFRNPNECYLFLLWRCQSKIFRYAKNLGFTIYLRDLLFEMCQIFPFLWFHR